MQGIRRAIGQTALLTAVALGAGCDRKPSTPQNVVPAQTRAAAAPAPVAGKPLFANAPQPPGLHLAYTHAIGLELPEASLAAHFDAAKERCLNTAALHCLLLEAQIGQPRYTPRGQEAHLSASLRVRLPHDQLAAFGNALTDPLPGEAPGLVHVIRQSTTAEDLGRPIADVTQRVAQLRTYLDSLKALEGRLTISVSDLVKIASETTQAQTQIEEAEATQRELSLRVDTEELDVDFDSQPPAQAAIDPVAQVRADSETIFRENLAEMARFSIAAAAWAPVALVGLLLVRLLFRRARK
jgi:hypothetical protein